MTKPHFSIRGDETYSVLCQHLQDKTVKDFRAYFETFQWSEIHCDSINECLKTLGDFYGIDYLTKCFVMPKDHGFDVYTYDNDCTTMDGKENYVNGLRYLATIHGRN
jgi:hypothetical protein